MDFSHFYMWLLTKMPFLAFTDMSKREKCTFDPST